MAKQPTHIAKIEIKNFRCIDHLTLDFMQGGQPRMLTVLAGANGCGKTSVLDAVSVVMMSKEPKMRERLDYVRWKMEWFQVSIRCTNPHQQVRDDWDLIYSYGKKSRNYQDWRTHNSMLSLEYFSLHLPSPSLISTKINELKPRLISTYYRSLRGKRTGDNTEIPVFERLKKFYSRFMGDEWQLDVIPVNNDPGSGDEVVLRKGAEVPLDITSLEMARNLASERSDIPLLVPLERLSSGQAALFGYAGPLIFRDEPADVVLIDEPEQHMHVQWQRLLLPALRELSPTTQFIAATHSLDVLGSVLPDERIFLMQDEDPRLSDDQQHDGATP